MGHDGQAKLVNDALVFLFAAGILVPILRRARVPAVLAFILSGVLLGPAGLGALVERWPALGWITVADPEAARPFAELGVLFLLFLIGLELSFEKLWALRRIVFGAGAVQCATSALAIGGAMMLLGLDPPAAAVLGLALALSSTAIVMQLLTESRRLAQPGGRTALGLLLFQDLLVAPILIFVGFVGRDADGGLLGAIVEALVEGTLAIGAIVFVGRFLLRHVFGLAAQAGGRDLLMALTLLTVVGAAVVTAGAGLSLALGAFMAGLLLGETEFKHQAEVDLDPFKGLLLGLFFMTVGMGLDLGGILGNLPVVVAGLVGLLLTKFVLVGLACRLLRVPGRIALETAFVLAPAGEFAFVVLSTALGLDVLDRSVANLAAAVAGLSMLLVPFLDVFGRRVARRLAPDASQSPWISSYEGLEGHVIIAGFGRVGSAIADILRSEETDFVALDRAPHRVAQCRNRGWKVYLGDADRPEILHRAGADGAAMLIVTVDDPASAERMVRAFRRVRPEAPILARARDHEHARTLVAAGASFVIPDAIEAGLQMAARALEDFGYPRETARDLISAVRDAEYRSATT